MQNRISLFCPFSICKPRRSQVSVRIVMKHTQSCSKPRTKVNPLRSRSRRIPGKKNTVPPEPWVFLLYTKKIHSSPVVMQPLWVLNLQPVSTHPMERFCNTQIVGTGHLLPLELGVKLHPHYGWALLRRCCMTEILWLLDLKTQVCVTGGQNLKSHQSWKPFGQ